MDTNAKIHFRDVRLFNNAGMTFPLCAANAKLLDLDKSAWMSTGYQEFVTCKNCIKVGQKRWYWRKNGQ